MLNRVVFGAFEHFERSNRRRTPLDIWAQQHVVHQKLTKIQSSSLRSRVDLIIYQRYHASPK